MYFGYIGPFVLLFILNSAIIYKATRFERLHRVAPANSTVLTMSRGAKRKAEMSRTVYSITIFYVITTLPSSVIGGYYYGYMLTLQSGQMIVNIINAAQSIYQSFNFFVLFYSNKLFAQEAKSFFFRLRLKFLSKAPISGNGHTAQITNRTNQQKLNATTKFNTIPKSTSQTAAKEQENNVLRAHFQNVNKF